MKIHTLSRSQEVARPLKEVFAFFSRPENLEALTPDSLSFKILTPSPLRMEAGVLIDYTLRLSGVFPVKWTTLIESYEPPYLFTDVQKKGPYAFWHHTHRFTSVPGGTLISDEVRYAMPWGVLGEIARRLHVENELRRIFDYRAKKIRQIFK